MAVQNKSKTIANINCLDKSKNMVYINPNFNRPQINNVPSSAAMHINPKFSHLVSNGYSNTQNKNKIYINPNFIKSRSVDDAEICISTSVNTQVISDKQNDDNNLFTTYQRQPAFPAPVTQSRYCLVRQNVINKPLNGTALDKAKNTFKLNKYKTVSWKDIKRNLDNVKTVTNNNLTRFETNTETPMNERVSTSLLNNRRNEFKLYNYNNGYSLKQDKIRTKIYADTHKKLYKCNPTNQSRVKKTKENLKKNNIPCPLFRKFGKCLRNERGRCEFLHDKKHVSICRKFIKGLCHDKDCLLSHDLTSKKMPTCYFYLQGTCTKAECPYLHVKLNEKTKICPDFVKGYCEKGGKCLLRHINISSERKNMVSQIRNSIGKKHNESKICHGKIHKKHHQAAEASQKFEKKSVDSTKFFAKSENCSENRYYDEHGDDGSTNESCKTIKPMRCKLGTLPSFIQL